MLYTVAPNIDGARTGTITIADTTITFTRAAGVIVVTTTLAAPVAQSPNGGKLVESLTPTLVVANAAAAGTAGLVTYPHYY